MIKNLKTNDWELHFYTGSDIETGLQRCKSLNISQKILLQAEANAKSDNCGSTITNITKKHICVLIGPQTSKSEMLNTLSHEIRHIVDTICENCEVESPANLTGEITAHFADWI